MQAAPAPRGRCGRRRGGSRRAARPRRRPAEAGERRPRRSARPPPRTTSRRAARSSRRRSPARSRRRRPASRRTACRPRAPAPRSPPARRPPAPPTEKQLPRPGRDRTVDRVARAGRPAARRWRARARGPRRGRWRLLEPVELDERSRRSLSSGMPGRCPRPRATACRPVGGTRAASGPAACSAGRSRGSSAGSAAAAPGRCARPAARAPPRNAEPVPAASAANSAASGASTSDPRKSATSGVVTPLSSFETSSELAEQVLDRVQRGVDLSDRGVAAALGERRQEQPRGLQRLQQVVAGGGEEAGLAEVGPLGLGLGGARAPPCARRRAPPAPRSPPAAPPRRVALGDVGVDGDEPAARQRVRRDLEHRAVGPPALVDVGPVAARWVARPVEQAVELALRRTRRRASL